jgi:uncharacterized membrane protein
MGVQKAVGQISASVGPWWPRRLRTTFSSWGLLWGALFFAASLTPSLLPRHYAVQGILSGMALAAGYGVGVFFVWLWRYLELPTPNATARTGQQVGDGPGVAIVMISFLWRATEWQNSVRRLMEMEPVETAYPWRVGLIAILIGVLIVVAARGIRICWRYVNGKLSA